MEENNTVEIVEAQACVGISEENEALEEVTEIEAEYEIEAEKRKQKNKMRYERYVKMGLACVSFLGECIVSLVILLGGILVFDEALTPLSALNMVLRVFKISGVSVYRDLFSIAFGILYFVALVKIIIHLVMATKRLIVRLTAGQDVYKQTGLPYEAQSIFVWFLFFYFSTTMVCGVYDNAFFTVGVIGILLTVCADLLQIEIERKGSWFDSALRLIKQGIVIAAFLVLNNALCSNYVQASVNSWDFFQILFAEEMKDFITFESVYEILILPILMFIAEIMFAGLVKAWIQDRFLRVPKENIKRLFIFLLIIMAATLLARASTNMIVTTETLQKLYEELKYTLLSAFVICLGVYVTTFFEKAEKEDIKDRIPKQPPQSTAKTA